MIVANAVHAAQRHRRRRVDGEESTGKNEILGRRVDGATNQLRVDLELGQRAAKLGRLLHFARRDLQANHLATLRQHPAGCVENLAARRRHLSLGGLLAFGAGAPILSVHQLNAARLHQDREGEQRERCVSQADSPRANHAWHAAPRLPRDAEEESAVLAWGCACSIVVRRSAAVGRDSTRRESPAPGECAPLTSASRLR